MSGKANVASVEAIEDFRTHLILYVSKARPALEEVSSDVLRLRLWLENDHRTVLEALVRRRHKELEAAQAALSSARMAVIKHETSAEQIAVVRARRNLEEAERKLKRLKYWDREFASVVEPLAKQLDKLHTLLAHDLGQAAAHLSHVTSLLAAYADVASPGTAELAAPTPGDSAGSGSASDSAAAGSSDTASPGGAA
jgi:multidrug resistance efflux pump